MKKLIIALGTVGMAVGIQAATISWASGVLYRATSKDGGWSTAAADKLTGTGDATGYLFNLTSAQYGYLTSHFDQETIYKAATLGTAAENSSFKMDFGSGVETVNAYARQGSMVGAVTIKDNGPYNTGDSAYGLLIYTYTDATYGNMYIANIGEYAWTSASSPTMKNMAWVKGGSSTTPASNTLGWNAAPVPEPTSGLLLLLGVAGMALRRRRA